MISWLGTQELRCIFYDTMLNKSNRKNPYLRKISNQWNYTADYDEVQYVKWTPAGPTKQSHFLCWSISYRGECNNSLARKWRATRCAVSASIKSDFWMKWNTKGVVLIIQWFIKHKPHNHSIIVHCWLRFQTIKTEHILCYALRYICASVLIGLMNVQQKNSHKNHRLRQRGKKSVGWAVSTEHNFRFYCFFSQFCVNCCPTRTPNWTREKHAATTRQWTKGKKVSSSTVAPNNSTQ